MRARLAQSTRKLWASSTCLSLGVALLGLQVEQALLRPVDLALRLLLALLQALLADLVELLVVLVVVVCSTSRKHWMHCTTSSDRVVN